MALGSTGTIGIAGMGGTGEITQRSGTLRELAQDDRTPLMGYKPGDDAPRPTTMEKIQGGWNKPGTLHLQNGRPIGWVSQKTGTSFFLASASSSFVSSLVQSELPDENTGTSRTLTPEEMETARRYAHGSEAQP
jgi:hypothetical protein